MAVQDNGLQYRHPHVSANINNTEITYSTADSNLSFFYAIVSEKGIDNKTQIVSTTAEFIDKYGEPNLVKYGQAAYNIINLLNGGAQVYVLRVLPDDATYAHAFLNIQTKVDKNSKTVLDLNGNTVKMDDVSLRVCSSYAQNKTTSEYGLQQELNIPRPNATLDGYTDNLLLGFYPKARGAAYNNLAFRLVLNSSYDEVYEFRTYTLEIIRYDEYNSPNLIEGPFYVSLDPDAMSNNNESMFIVDVLETYSSYVGCIFNEEVYDRLTTLINPDVNPSHIDILTGQTRTSLGQPETFYCEDTKKYEDVHIKLQKYDSFGYKVVNNGYNVLNISTDGDESVATNLSIDNAVRQEIYESYKNMYGRMSNLLGDFLDNKFNKELSKLISIQEGRILEDEGFGLDVANLRNLKNDIMNKLFMAEDTNEIKKPNPVGIYGVNRAVNALNDLVSKEGELVTNIRKSIVRLEEIVPYLRMIKLNESETSYLNSLQLLIDRWKKIIQNKESMLINLDLLESNRYSVMEKLVATVILTDIDEKLNACIEIFTELMDNILPTVEFVANALDSRVDRYKDPEGKRYIENQPKYLKCVDYKVVVDRDVLASLGKAASFNKDEYILIEELNKDNFMGNLENVKIGNAVAVVDVLNGVKYVKVINPQTKLVTVIGKTINREISYSKIGNTIPLINGVSSDVSAGNSRVVVLGAANDDGSWDNKLGAYLVDEGDVANSHLLVSARPADVNGWFYNDTRLVAEVNLYNEEFNKFCEFNGFLKAEYNDEHIGKLVVENPEIEAHYIADENVVVKPFEERVLRITNMLSKVYSILNVLNANVFTEEYKRDKIEGYNYYMISEDGKGLVVKPANFVIQPADRDKYINANKVLGKDGKQLEGLVADETVVVNVSYSGVLLDLQEVMELVKEFLIDIKPVYCLSKDLLVVDNILEEKMSMLDEKLLLELAENVEKAMNKYNEFLDKNTLESTRQLMLQHANAAIVEFGEKLDVANSEVLTNKIIPYDYIAKLDGGSDGCIDYNNKYISKSARTANINNLLVKGYTGLIDEDVINVDLLKFKYLLDANYSVDVKNAMLNLVRDIRRDLFVWFDTEFCYSPEDALAWRINKFPISTNFAAIYTQNAMVYDAYQGRDIKVSMSYFLASKIPYCFTQYGLQYPMAGSRRGVIDGYKDNSISFYPNKLYKDQLYNRQINYVETDGSSTRLGSQLTSDVNTTPLSNINNVITVLNIKRDVESMSESLLFEFNDSEIVGDFQQRLNNSLSSYIANKSCESINANVTASDYDKLQKILRVSVTVKFLDIIERVIINIDVVK